MHRASRALQARRPANDRARRRSLSLQFAGVPGLAGFRVVTVALAGLASLVALGTTAGR